MARITKKPKKISKTWVLMKVSVPGWDKDLPSEEACRKELLKYICGTCLDGDEWDDQPTPPDVTSIKALLSTSCGCEFELIRPGQEDYRTKDWNNT